MIFQADGTTAAIDYRTEATSGDGRQVVTVGDPSINNNVAVVQQTDPASNTQGIVVRDVNTSAIVSRLGSTLFVALDPGHLLGSVTANVGTGTMAIFFDQSAPTVKAIPSTGTFTVQFDPGHELGSIKGTNSSLAVFLDPGHLLGSVTANAGTGSFNVQLDPGHTLGKVDAGLGTFNVALDPGHTIGNIATLGSITNTVAVFFSPASPAVSATFSAASIEVIPTTGSRKTTDDASASQRVLIVGSQTNASLAISSVGSITNTVAVFFSPANPAVSATFSAASIEVIPTTGSRKITDDAAAAMRVLVVGTQTNASLTVNGTVTSNAGTGTLTVAFDPGHTLGSITTLGSVTNTVNVQLDPAHTLGKVEPGVGTFQVYLPDTGHELGSIRGVTNSINVYLGATAGTVAIKIDPGYNVIGDQSTLVIPIVTAGNFNGVSTLGKTIAGPTSSRVLKIYAYSITTTAQVSLTAKLTNGAGSSPTVYEEWALQAPTQGVSGANLAVTPPGYLFATASGSTLALVLDSASLVHYSVKYFEESA